MHWAHRNVEVDARWAAGDILAWTALGVSFVRAHLSDAPVLGGDNDQRAATPQTMTTGAELVLSRGITRLTVRWPRAGSRHDRHNDMTSLVVFTIGHSTRRIAAFISVLKAHGVETTASPPGTA